MLLKNTSKARFIFFSAICALIGVSTFAVASAMDQALYFPEDLPPTWANSWAEVSVVFIRFGNH